jgi:PTH1 family peptidyl-tRNA hydrolase
MKLIVGLGNPGEKYKLTRHNIGANVAKRLAKLNNINLRRRGYLSRFGEGRIGREEVNIILPETFMNLSGGAVSSVVKSKKIALSDILVICDDADLKLGTIRMRSKGSDGGHRGLRSIIENLKTQSFPRLRIGIGKEKDLRSYVLRSFNKNEEKLVKEVEETSIEAAICWLTRGIAQAMNTYNARREE